jgi:hypothetical protein
MFKIVGLFMLIITISIVPIYAQLDSPKSVANQIIPYPILSKERLSLTQDYAKRHYGMNHYFLISPKIIVIHYAELPNLNITLRAAKKDTLAIHRVRILPYGTLNTSSHFVVDQDGKIFSLVPTTIMARHTMGFNHVAIGITNVGTNASDLTENQVIANANLVNVLTQKHPSIEHIIGHLEYMNQSMPHYKYFRRVDTSLEPMIQIDPGWSFMRELRALLDGSRPF